MSKRLPKVRVSLECVVCGKTVELLLRQADAKKRKACSIDCSRKISVAAMRTAWHRLSKEEKIESMRKRGAFDRFKQIDFRARVSERMKKKNPMKNPLIAEKVSNTLKKKWHQKLSDEMKRRWKEGKIPFPWERSQVSCLPNKQETLLGTILEMHADTKSFKYVGNGSFWIGPCRSGKRRNPDFLCRDLKCVILLHGEFYHTEKDAKEQEEDYLGKGWNVLTIWSKELSMRSRPSLLKKISLFVDSLSESDLLVPPTSIM